jgi:hypothetical protein
MSEDDEQQVQITFDPGFFDSPDLADFAEKTGKTKAEVISYFIAAARAAEQSGKVGTEAMVVYGQVLSALMGDPDAEVEVGPALDGRDGGTTKMTMRGEKLMEKKDGKPN